jgi:hypothetical protein
MSYINYSILTSKQLTLHELGVLQLIKQSRIEPLSEVIEFEVKDTNIIEKFSNLDYIDYVKGKKNQSQFELIRTTKKANDVLEDVAIPEISIGDLEMFTYLSNIYLAHEDKDRVIGNAKKVKLYCAILRNHLEMTLHEFYYYLEFFLDAYPYTKKLENLFMDSNKVRYGSFINNIDESPLFQFWQKEENSIRNYWSRKIKE